jgi:hypothetical protein
VPHKNRDGIALGSHRSIRRAVRYDVHKIKKSIDELMEKKFEVQVHGIDSWKDPEEGKREYETIKNLTGNKNLGVRMHWLFFDQKSPKVLDKIGYVYDSSFGYNDAIGFKAGTSQPFRPFGAERLYELPLLVQDTAMFYRDRMNMAEGPAMKLVKSMIDKTELFGGVFTINWHHRSIAPERLWGGFYINLLNYLKHRNARFATVGDAIEWFKARRALSFEMQNEKTEGFGIIIKGPAYRHVQDMVLRVYSPGQDSHPSDSGINNSTKFCDYPIEEYAGFQPI